MYWTEDDSPEELRIPDHIVDILFAIDCRCIPIDHAHVLASALQDALPWITNVPELAIHSIHVASSQNGWERPAHDTTAELMVSRRTKLTIRAPQEQVGDLLQQLPGTRLDLAGHPLVIGAGKVKPLSQETTLFARYVTLDDATDHDQDEERFLAAAVAALADMEIQVRKALCGKTTPIATPRGPLATRSLMLSKLSKEESLRLQQHGLGRYPLLGCGIFIPHKGIDPVRPG